MELIETIVDPRERKQHFEGYERALLNIPPWTTK